MNECVQLISNNGSYNNKDVCMYWHTARKWDIDINDEFIINLNYTYLLHL